VTAGAEEPRSGRRRWLRRGGYALGLILLAGALLMVWGQRETMSSALESIRRPDPVTICVLLAAVIGNLVLSSLFMSVLMSRYGRVGLGEMQGLIAGAALLNYLPLRPGLLSRIAYHRTVNGIAVAASTRAVIEGVVISAIVSLTLVAAALAARSGGAPWVLAAPSGLFAGTLALPATRRWGLAALVRNAELFVWALRYHAAFAILGLDIDLAAAVGFACAGSLANLVPFVSNGLGLREWSVGLLAPVMTTYAVPLGATAEIVNRAGELLVIVPAGLIARWWLGAQSRRRQTEPSPGPESPDPRR
jgi:hypothetical protein